MPCSCSLQDRSQDGHRDHGVCRRCSPRSSGAPTAPNYRACSVLVVALSSSVFSAHRRPCTTLLSAPLPTSAFRSPSLAALASRQSSFLLLLSHALAARQHYTSGRTQHQHAAARQAQCVRVRCVMLFKSNDSAHDMVTVACVTQDPLSVYVCTCRRARLQAQRGQMSESEGKVQAVGAQCMTVSHVWTRLITGI